ncbi:MAG: Txe/YoeB family addiction module toxin [Spirochaetia bacterium]|nr:Txe/YoeB family addiction module toxin [Spirochaetia bacterium]
MRKKSRKSNSKKNAEKIRYTSKGRSIEDVLPDERLLGDLAGSFSRRINIQHRIVYQVYEKERIVKIIRMWTHYE